jgi:uncharacterized protein (TIGR02246 family)
MSHRHSIGRLTGGPQLALMVLVVASAACAPQGSQPSSTLETLGEQWEAALNAGDVDAIAEFYTEDCRLMPPNGELEIGREAVREEFSGMIAAGFSGRLETLEAVTAADIGYRVGTYTITAADGAVVDRGKFMESWRNVGGTWKMANDIWNSDMPAAASAGTTMIVTHEVEDFDRWLAAWRGEDGRHEMFAEHGVPGTRLFRNVDEPDTIAVLMEVADIEAMQAFMSSADAEAAKAEDGVKSDTMQAYSEIE